MGERRERTIEWITTAIEGRGDVEGAREFFPGQLLDRIGAEGLLASLTKAGQGRRVAEVRPGPVPAAVAIVLADNEGKEPPILIECVLDADDKVFGLMGVPPEVADVMVRTERTADLAAGDRKRVQALFADAYEEANARYLDDSLATLRWITMGALDDELVGFALGEQRVLDVPRLGPTATTLAGLACVSEQVRRRGLFRRLSNLVLTADGAIPFDGTPVLGAGRMAHPASYRVYRGHPTLVPQAGVSPNEFQQQVGAVVAAAYRVASFDPQTFVCRGKGTPIGYPRMTQEVEPEEWDVFAPVDRSRGDALLAVIWQPTAPEGWM